MNSQERKDARYQRRQEQRQLNRQKRCDALGSIEDIYSFHNLYSYGKECCKGVRWKQSTQNFERHLFSGTANRRSIVLSGNYKPMKYYKFTLNERGKIRHIEAPHISDRQVQKVLSQVVLRNLYGPVIIHDNTASQENKGYHFQMDRLKKHLHWFYRRYEKDGYIALFDIKQFFPSAPHNRIYDYHKNYILTNDIKKVADTIISKESEYGMPLGIEPSQLEMVMITSSIDNYIKCQLGVHCYGHYMDDFYIIEHDLDKLLKTIKTVFKLFNDFGFSINEKKTKIVSLTKKFKFCKCTYKLTETGKIITHGNKKSFKHAKRKLKVMRTLLDDGNIEFLDVLCLFQCQVAYFNNFNDHERVIAINRLFYNLFHEEIKLMT